MPLEIEQQTYANELPKLLGSVGKFVVIHGKEVAGEYDTYTDALQIGYERYGLKPFLVKQIQLVEQIHCFTRDISPCRI